MTRTQHQENDEQKQVIAPKTEGNTAMEWGNLQIAIDDRRGIDRSSGGASPGDDLSTRRQGPRRAEEESRRRTRREDDTADAARMRRKAAMLPDMPTLATNDSTMTDLDDDWIKIEDDFDRDGTSTEDSTTTRDFDDEDFRRRWSSIRTSTSTTTPG